MKVYYRKWSSISSLWDEYYPERLEIFLTPRLGTTEGELSAEGKRTHSRRGRNKHNLHSHHPKKAIVFEDP